MKLISRIVLLIIFAGLLAAFVGCAGIGGVQSPAPTALTQNQAIENQIAAAEQIFTGAQIVADFATLSPAERSAVNLIFQSVRKDLDKAEADARSGKLVDTSTVLYVAGQALTDYQDYRATHGG